MVVQHLHAVVSTIDYITDLKGIVGGGAGDAIYAVSAKTSARQQPLAFPLKVI